MKSRHKLYKYMSSIATLYSNEVKKHFKVLYANWEPGAPIELGDYGILDNNLFIPMGKLEDDFPEFKGNVIKTMVDPFKDHKEFRSEKGVEVAILSKGSVNSSGVTLAKATLELKFSSKNSIFFNAAECTTNRISNKYKIGQILKQIMENGKWQKEYCVVTDLVHAGKTLIAISHSNNSGITFEAESPALEKINLGDASVKLNLKSEKNIGYKVDAGEGLNIMFGLCKIKNLFLWWGGEFGQKSVMLTESMKYKIENSTAIKTETSVDELFFGQMGKE